VTLPLPKEAVNLHRPRQRKAAVTAGAASIPADLVLMSCVRLRADPARSVCLVNGPLGSAQSGVKHMQLITAAQRQKVLENGRAQRAAIDRQDQCLDFEPVVKLFILAVFESIHRVPIDIFQEYLKE